MGGGKVYLLRDRVGWSVTTVKARYRELLGLPGGPVVRDPASTAGNAFDLWSGTKIGHAVQHSREKETSFRDHRVTKLVSGSTSEVFSSLKWA